MVPALQSQPEIITLEQCEALPENRGAEVFDGVVYEDLYINFLIFPAC